MTIDVNSVTFLGSLNDKTVVTPDNHLTTRDHRLETGRIYVLVRFMQEWTESDEDDKVKLLDEMVADLRPGVRLKTADDDGFVSDNLLPDGGTTTTDLHYDHLLLMTDQAIDDVPSGALREWLSSKEERILTSYFLQKFNGLLLSQSKDDDAKAIPAVTIEDLKHAMRGFDECIDTRVVALRNAMLFVRETLGEDEAIVAERIAFVGSSPYLINLWLLDHESEVLEAFIRAYNGNQAD